MYRVILFQWVIFLHCQFVSLLVVFFFLSVQKLRMPSGDFKEDRLTTSAQSTPSGTPSVTPSVTPCASPHSSPALSRRYALCCWMYSLIFDLYPDPKCYVERGGTGTPNAIFPNRAHIKCHMAHLSMFTLMFMCCFCLGKCRTWFQQSPAPFLATPELNSLNPSTDMGGNEGGGGGERWNFFGTRSVVHKSPTDPGSETSTGERFIPTPASEFWLYCSIFTLLIHSR